MNQIRNRYLAVCLLAAVCLPCTAGDWPTYRHDIRRSAVTDEKLALPLQLAWRHTCAQPPAPAWPDPFKLVNRLDFDYAFQPVIAEGIVCFGSSADDTVRALDARTGREKWRFSTGGPVRFAPHIEKGRVYCASDDGYVYCLDAGAGALVWKFRAAPQDDCFIGNHRMISRWPVRTGVVVTDGVVYAVAGMWKSEGISTYALQADTGRIIWCNDSAGGTPQGHLLIGGGLLLVPNGNERPTPFNRETGASVHWSKSGVGGAGGTWAAIDGNNLHMFASHRAEVLTIQKYALDTGMAGRGWGVKDVPQLAIANRLKPGREHAKGHVSAIVAAGRPYARKAYAIAMADKTLFLGHDDAVSAEDPATQKELWRMPIRGVARAMAIADGRLFVSTDRGTIFCFEPGAAAMGTVTEAGPPAPVAPQPQPADPVADSIIAQLQPTGMDRGFALVVGDPDGKLSTALASRSHLRVIAAMKDEPAAAALRERLLRETAIYGSRIHAQVVARLERLPYPQYFANAVIVAGIAPGLSATELYRVLRPCGGMLLAPGLKQPDADALVKATGADAKEIRTAATGPAVVRGKLAGALDWDTSRNAYTTDQRVKWPLRIQWFGGPSTRQVQNAEQGAPGPTAGGGRYVMFSEGALTAVDAYNGAILWSHPIPKQFPQIRDVDGVLYSASEPTQFAKGELSRRALINDEHVYLILGKVYCRGLGDVSVKLDARTGAQLKYYGPYSPPAAISLKTAATWPVEVDAEHSGAVKMEATEKGLVLTLTTRDPAVTPLDAWELYFDLRPPETRYGLYESGVFNVRIAAARDANTPPAWSPGNGAEFPALELSGARTADGTKAVVVVPWSELQRIAGAKATNFGFAATLNSHDGVPEASIARRHLFGDWTADALNNGWAAVTVDDAVTAVDPARPPAIVASAAESIKKKPAGRASPGSAVSASLKDGLGFHPLTGEPVPKVYGEAPVCGAPYYSASLISRRGSIYDYTDDSGGHYMSGVKTGCTTPQLAALGMLIISEEHGHCVCNYPLRTSLALATTDRRLGEDWADFYERDVDTEVRQAYLNLGAPGDRRDGQDVLWLGFPRAAQLQTPDDFPNPDHPLPYPQGMRDAQTGLWYRRQIRPSAWVPLSVESSPGFGPYHFSVDRIAIRGSDRPWLYGSGYRGIRKAELKLNFFKPLAALAVRETPVIDGKLSEGCWAGELKATNGIQPLLPYTDTRVLFRQDERNLYVGVRRPPIVYRPTRAIRLGGTSRGTFPEEPRPWRTGKSKPDALAPQDNWWRLIVGDRTGGKAVYLDLAADGTRADALYDEASKKLDGGWNAAWESAVTADAGGMVIEMAIPWPILEKEGLKREQLAVNFLMADPGIGTESLTYLGADGYNHCVNFTPLGLGAPAPLSARPFTVRLHFAEPEADVKPGQRVFDVKLQGQTALKNLDIVKETGAPLTALVKEFKGIKAADALTLEFQPAEDAATPSTVPIICAMEVICERSATDGGQ